MLERASQAVLGLPSLARIVDEHLEHLNQDDMRRLNVTLNHFFLQHELKRSLDALADAALYPLTTWLQELGVTGLTLIPCWWLAAFPLAAAEVASGKTMGDLFDTSVAPNARSLLHDERANASRSGMYALGNPHPTHQELGWGESEALTIAKLARQF